MLPTKRWICYNITYEDAFVYEPPTADQNCFSLPTKGGFFQKPQQSGKGLSGRMSEQRLKRIISKVRQLQGIGTQEHLISGFQVDRVGSQKRCDFLPGMLQQNKRECILSPAHELSESARMWC